jgi:hypothetical protein
MDITLKTQKLAADTCQAWSLRLSIGARGKSSHGYWPNAIALVTIEATPSPERLKLILRFQGPP